ncbi:hypothetical protein PG997_006739 [Apiospora hydei]|uniref:Cytochrome P450 n=1 Tax=Apiospora hydei TaxID=1337664 RepID=A0ABR1WPM0_9PEZI
MIMYKLTWEPICNSQRWYTDSHGSDSVSVPLYQWASDISIDVVCHAFFGPSLQGNRPDVTRAFMQFEDYSWQALYQYPNFLCGSMNKSREKVRGAIEEYFALPDEQRFDRSWLVAQLEGEMKQLDMSPQDISALFFQLYWGINANLRKALFWALSHLLFDTELMESVRHETRPAIKGNGIDMSYLLDPQTCPRLLSLWDETIRMTAYAASVRFLTRDIELGGKTLRKGGWIMIPQRQLHYNTDVFGESASTFVADRFVANPELRKHPSLRPFGGGATLCPGRDYSKHIALAFIAADLNMLEITLDPPTQHFPMGEEGNPSPGIIGVKGGHDLTVRLRPRARTENIM